PGRDARRRGRGRRFRGGSCGHGQHALVAAGIEPCPDIVDQLRGAADRRLVRRPRRRGGREQGGEREREGRESRSTTGGRRTTAEERRRHGCPSYRSPAW